MDEKLSLNMFDNDVVKWKHNGTLYALHVQSDDNSINPRTDMDNVTIMACWHRRYSLGDTIQDQQPCDFWLRLVQENVSPSEVLAAAEAGELNGIRIAPNEEDAKLVDVYTFFESDEVREYEAERKDTVARCLMEELTTEHCMRLLEPYAVWLPLWLYDHSGITMSCGARTGQFADQWDSGQVGWIVALKKTIMEEIATEYVEETSGERVPDEQLHENESSACTYQARSLTNETWKQRAIEIMECDVKIYDQMLTGDVYGFTLYSAPPVEDGEEPNWNEEDSCWGFFGSNIMKNGIEEAVGCGLRAAVTTGEYVQTVAQKYTVTRYKF